MSPGSMDSPQRQATGTATTTLPLNTSKRTSFQDLSGVKGAEGGVEAIVLRRRGSNSFKTMSTGGLVSNSPFTKRSTHTTSSSGQTHHQDSDSAARPLHTASRIPTAASPTATRKLSGSNRKPSLEQLSRSSSNENNAPGTRQQDLSAVATSHASRNAGLPRSRSTSPSVPFKPVRSTSASVAAPNIVTPNALSTSSAVASPFKPTRSGNEAARRETASFAALKSNGLVSSSPFVQVLSNGTSPDTTTEASPPLPAAPYEIAPLAHESAPFWATARDEDIERPLSPKLASTANLGHRPGHSQAPLTGPSDRRIAGSSIPPPNTPPHQRSMSISVSPGQSPLSALSPQRRGMRGPRELAYTTDEPEDATSGKRLKRQPSGKTVTWAATEEVLEFEADDRRESGASMMSSGSEDMGRYYGRGGDDSSEDGNVSLGFEEGGSVEVHDIDDSYADDDEGEDDQTAQSQAVMPRTVLQAKTRDVDDDDMSQVSTADSQVEDMIDVIDSFMSQDPTYDQVDVNAFSPPPTTHAFMSSPKHAHNYGTMSSPPFGDLVMHQSEASSSSQAGSTDDSTSISSYGDENDDNDADTTAKFDDAIVTTVSEPQFQQASVVKLASPILLDQSSQATQSVSFALPDIQKTSPFMPFEDDGAADSVVSLYMERNVQPLAPRRTASSQLLQGAVMSKEAGTPVMGLFGAQPIHHVQQTSPHLSRSGSIMSERASTVSSNADSAASSWLGSISSGRALDRNSSVNSGSLFMSRDRLQQKMREHQALLGGGGSTRHQIGSTLDLYSQGSDHGAFPTDMMPHVPSNQNKSVPTTSFSSREVIQARPAVKVTSATLSTDMLPNMINSNGLSFEIGTPLTEQVAAELVSPLDRLQRGVDEKKDTENGWQSGDSLLGHATATGEDAEETRTDEGQGLRVDARSRLKGRRRSSSTSDVPIAETTSIHEEEPRFKLPAHGFEHHLDAVLPGKGSGFSSTIEADLDDIFNSRDRSYRIHERRNVIHAADAFKAVERDPAKAWRRKRPSNMHEVNRSLSMMSISASASQRKAKAGLSGQLFVILREAVFENMPMPQAKTSLRITLDNGKQKVEAGSRLLEKTVIIRSEFELVSSDSLEFDITFHAPPKKIASSVTLSAPPPPSSPTKSSRGLRALLSSPKKKKAEAAAAAAAAAQRASMPVPEEPFDPFYDFVSPTGELATMHFVFANEAARCRLRRHRVNVPLEFKGMRKIAKGALSMDLLYVPSIPGVPRNQLAASMDDAIKGMELAECESKVTHEGVLTQLGGDTTVWRRRNFKLRSNRLVPYSEVTKMSHVEIDMSLVKSIRDLNAVGDGDSDSIRSDADDEAMDFSFRLSFKDKSVIDLYADDQESKQKWMDVLGALLASPAVHRKAAPVWALTLRRLVAAGKV
ncbi:hypothetical protein ACM66B_000680 [Microbotryomycetes sp. NB124-2]